MATAQQKMTVGEKLEKALEFKDVGNTAYKEGNYKVAAKNYHKAILYLKVINFKKLEFQESLKLRFKNISGLLFGIPERCQVIYKLASYRSNI